METERKLQQKAMQKGLTMKSYLEELVRTDLNKNSTHEVPSKVLTSTEEWLAEFDAWTASHKPLPFEADDSRESIYAGCGE